MLFLMLCFMLVSYGFGGSPCPPREEIYPCICIDRRIGKSKFDTTLICHGLDNGDSFSSIEPTLKEMELNTFLLYDSYWPSATRSLLMDSRIPVNHLSTFRIQEIEIVDTALQTFGCPAVDECKTNYLKRFTAINSTMSDKASCNNNGPTIKLWISCPGDAEYVVINKGFTSDTTLKPEFFPEPMRNLKFLHLPNNSITRIDKRTFTHSKFPVLQTLDLSYNSIRDVRNIFSSTMEIKHLDLSHNFLRSLVEFQHLPQLQSLKLNNNYILTLLENEWQNVPSSLRHVDLTHNRIECNCSMKFVNSTFPIHTALLGSCASPSEVENKKLRKASRFLIARCNKDGEIGGIQTTK